jgi:hypothetical protein
LIVTKATDHLVYSFLVYLVINARDEMPGAMAFGEAEYAHPRWATWSGVVVFLEAEDTQATAATKTVTMVPLPLTFSM